ncbi:MAG: MFS transporter [Nocardioidaceae bacterium]
MTSDADIPVPPAPPPRSPLPRVVWWLVAARTVNRMAAFSLPFLALLLAQEQQWSTTSVGLAMTGFGLATIPSRLLGGRLADRLGRRTTIVIGLTGCAASQFGLALTGSLGGTIAAVLALGLCFEIYEPPSQALIADLVPLQDQPAAHGLLATGLAVAGVAAGGLATWLTHIDLRWLFVADAASCLVCAGLLALTLPRDCPPSGGVDITAAAGCSPWRDRRLIMLLAMQTGFAVVYLQSTFALPLSLTGRGLPASTLAVLLTTSALTFVVGQPVLRLDRVRRLRRPTMLRTGYLLMAAGLAGYAVATSLWVYVLATVVVAMGDLLVIGHLMTAAAAVAPPGQRARYLAVFGTSWGAAAVLSPAVGAGLLSLAGIGVTWGVAAGLCALLATVVARVPALAV